MELKYLGGENVTISGHSAGAYMTHQMHVIFSKSFKGAGLFAGGPYAVGSIENVKESPE